MGWQKKIVTQSFDLKGIRKTRTPWIFKAPSGPSAPFHVSLRELKYITGTIIQLVLSSTCLLGSENCSLHDKLEGDKVTALLLTSQNNHLPWELQHVFSWLSSRKLVLVFYICCNKGLFHSSRSYKSKVKGVVMLVLSEDYKERSGLGLRLWINLYIAKLTLLFFTLSSISMYFFVLSPSF